MRTPESHHETESTLQGKTDVSEVLLVTRGEGGNADVPEQSQTREDLEKALNEAKKSEAQLVESEARLRTIIDMVPSFLWTSFPDGSKEYLNKRWYDYTGLSMEEGQGWGWKVVVHPEDLDRLVREWLALLDSRKPGELETRIRRYDGVYRWFLIRIVPLLDEQGNVVKWFGSNTDIEDRKRAEEKLRQDEIELRQIADAVPQAINVMDPKGKVLYANKGVLEYTGLSAEDVKAEDFRARIFHPDDFRNIKEERERLLAAGLPFEIEQRARRKDGQFRWFLIRYNPLRDNQGHIIRWYATGTDIDDRKQAENKLRQDERELRQLIDFLPQHVVVLNKEGKLLQANKTMLDYNGYTLEEMQGAGTQERIKRDLHPDDLERVKNARSVGLSRGVPFEIEKRMLGKDGRYRWFLFRYKPVLNEEGHIVRWFATATDIEERRHAEDRMRNENVALREDIVRSSMFEEIVGSSEPLRQVLAQVSKVAPTDSTVLILGETGTGKELIARAIHNRSKRSARAFIRVNCAAISPSLIASELFGHERGSFTGALQRHLGRFESADGGTIFLDEVGDLPPETQVALLRVLQEREFERVGGSQTVSVDVRVLAATNRDLSAAVGAGTFRQDLFYRLNVFPIRIPPLRERVDDISLLVGYLIDRYAQKAGKKIRNINKNTLDLFQTYDWPGNIRELQNVIERAVILCDGETFSVDEAWLTRVAPRSAVMSVPLAANLVEREREMVETALREAEGVVGGPTGAAAKLGIPRQTLESKIKKLGINRHRFKTS